MVVSTKLSHDDWRKLFNEWQTSGMTQSKFCANHGIAHSRFCYWRKRLGLAKQKQPSTFTQLGKVTTPSSMSASTGVAVEIKLVTGVQLRVFHDTDATQLKSVIAMLEGDYAKTSR